jgi:hypothetical protein
VSQRDSRFLGGRGRTLDTRRSGSRGIANRRDGLGCLATAARGRVQRAGDVVEIGNGESARLCRAIEVRFRGGAERVESHYQLVGRIIQRGDVAGQNQRAFPGDLDRFGDDSRRAEYRHFQRVEYGANRVRDCRRADAE